MSWLFEPKKDVAVNDSVGEVTSNLRSGGFRMGKPPLYEELAFRTRILSFDFPFSS